MNRYTFLTSSLVLSLLSILCSCTPSANTPAVKTTTPQKSKTTIPVKKPQSPHAKVEKPSVADKPKADELELPPQPKTYIVSFRVVDLKTKEPIERAELWQGTRRPYRKWEFYLDGITPYTDAKGIGRLKLSKGEHTITVAKHEYATPSTPTKVTVADQDITTPIVIEMGRYPTIEGVVLAADGTPVAGATLVPLGVSKNGYLSTTDGYYTNPPYRTLSDAEGRFSFAIKHDRAAALAKIPERFSFAVYSDQHGQVIYEVKELFTDHKITLDPFPTYEFNIKLVKMSGEPLSGAKVSIKAKETQSLHRNLGLWKFTNPKTFTGVSDAKGLVAITAPAVISLVYIDAPGYSFLKPIDGIRVKPRAARNLVPFIWNFTGTPSCGLTLNAKSWQSGDRILIRRFESDPRKLYQRIEVKGEITKIPPLEKGKWHVAYLTNEGAMPFAEVIEFKAGDDQVREVVGRGDGEITTLPAATCKTARYGFVSLYVNNSEGTMGNVLSNRYREILKLDAQGLLRNRIHRFKSDNRYFPAYAYLYVESESGVMVPKTWLNWGICVNSPSYSGFSQPLTGLLRESHSDYIAGFRKRQRKAPHPLLPPSIKVLAGDIEHQGKMYFLSGGSHGQIGYIPFGQAVKLGGDIYPKGALTLSYQTKVYLGGQSLQTWSQRIAPPQQSTPWEITLKKRK